jgi:hypothetical protein
VKKVNTAAAAVTAGSGILRIPGVDFFVISLTSATNLAGMLYYGPGPAGRDPAPENPRQL